MSLKIFLTALAIVDDLGAILVIAIFYTSQIDFTWLAIALLIISMLFIMNKLRVTRMIFYLIPAFVVGYAFLHSGVHSTIAGVLMAMTIPTRPRFTKKYFTYKSKYFLEEFKHYDKPGVELLSNPSQLHAIDKMRYVSTSAVSPAQRLEHLLHPLVTFLVMPVFALANAGVDLSGMGDGGGVFASTLTWGIFLGLVLGKPIGIFLFSWLTIKSKLAVMPEEGRWGTLLGVACLGGIGFTMSIFIDGLAFSDPASVDTGKIAVLIASVCAAVLGTIVINAMGKSKTSAVK